MNFSVMNAVKAYFRRNWRRQDMMNSGLIRSHSYAILMRVYFTLFWAMLCSTNGSLSHLVWEVGGLLTVLLTVASVLWLHFTSPQRVMKRFSLLMISAFFFGASVTNYLFATDKYFVTVFLVGTTFSIGVFLFVATTTRQRSKIYIGCLTNACLLMFSSFVVNALFPSFVAHSMLKVMTMVTLFIGYFVLYSQEILYDARFGDINVVNRTLTIFLHLPAVVVHAARLWLRGNTQQRSRHRIAWNASYRINRGE